MQYARSHADVPLKPLQKTAAQFLRAINLQSQCITTALRLQTDH